MAVGAAIAALVVTVASAYQQNKAAKEAAKERKDAGKVQQAEQTAVKNDNRRQQIREERVRRASIIQASQNTGVSESSGQLGATSALGSLISGNLASTSRQANSSNAIGGHLQSATNLDAKVSTWGQIGAFSSSIFGMAAGSAASGGGSPNINPPVDSGQNYSPVTAKPQTSIFG
jgi:hypothetical protein